MPSSPLAILLYPSYSMYFTDFINEIKTHVDYLKKKILS